MLTTWLWRPWDQTLAVHNARSASREVSRARTEREEINAYVEHILGQRLPTQSA